MPTLLKSLLPHRVYHALRILRRGTPPEQPLLGMTVAAEQVFYARCAHDLRGTPGALVDLGCWMGSTCLALAKGLGSPPRDMIYAFDRFIWEDWMNHHSREVLCDYVPGDSFLPEVRRRTRDFRDCITLIEADLTAFTWDRGDIKLLLVDAMKSKGLARAIARSFYPSLQPGAVLIHQDFKHYYTPQIHILQFRLRSFFGFTHNVPGGGTVAFTLSGPIPRADIEQASDLTLVPDAEVDAAFEHSLGLVGDEGRAAVAAAHVMHFVHARDPAKARERLARYPEFVSDYDFGRAIQELKSLEGP